MATADIFNFTDTWNDGGTTFNAIKVNVTNTSSAANSKLLDLQIGGDSKLAVGTDGQIFMDGFVDLNEIATPANPSVNIARIYARDDGGTTRLYFRDSIGTETQLSTAAGVFTDEQAQDAVGAIFTDSSTIDFTYNDATPSISAVLIPGGITTLANLSSIQGRAVVLSDTGMDVLFGWDDSASSYKNFILTDFTTEPGPAPGDFVLIYRAEGDVRKVDWSDLPGSTGGLNNVSEDLDPVLGGNLDVNEFALEITTALTNTVSNEHRLRHTTSGVPAVGIGLGLAFEQETAADHYEVGMRLDVVSTDVSDTTEDFDTVFNQMSSGNLTERLRLLSDGTMNLNSVKHTATNVGFDVLYAWDFSAQTYKSMLLADYMTEVAPAAGDFLILYRAEGDVRKVDWDDLPSGGGGSNAFGTLQVSGQSDVVADAAPDILTLVAGTGITITTDAGTDTVTFNTTITQYTDELAQDAIGTILVDSTTIDFTYDDGVPSITAIVKDASISTAKIIDANVTYAKIQDVSAASNLLGRGDSGAGDVQEITLGTNLAMSGTTLNATGGGGTPGGSDTQVQYNDGGAFGGDAGLTYNETTDTLSVAGNVELGHVSDTTLARSSAGNVSIEGNVIYRAGGTDVALADGGTGTSLSDPGADRIIAWDDSAGVNKFSALADLNTEAAPAAGDFLLAYTAEDALVKINWSSLPAGGGGISNVVEDTTPELGGNLESNNFDIIMEQFSADAVSADLFFDKSRNAVIGSHTVVQVGDVLGQIVFRGSDGTNFENAAAIIGKVDSQTPGADDMPGYLSFQTTQNNTATLVQRMFINHAGLVGIGPGVGTFTGSNVRFQVAADTGSDFVTHFQGFGNNAFGIFNIYSKTRNASASGHTVVANDDSVMILDSWASDGDEYLNLASIKTEIDGSPGNGDMPGRIVFSVTPDAGSTPAEALRISNAKKLIAANAAFSFGGFEAVFSDAGADRLFGWDENTNTYKTLALADIATEATPAAGDFLMLYGAEGDLRKVDWSSLPGGGSTNAFGTIVVAGQSDVVADAAPDTLTLVAGTNITLTTDAGTDTITIAASGGGGGISNVVEDTTPQLGGNLDLNAFNLEVLTANTNTVSTGHILRHTTSATPAAGIGLGLSFEVETASTPNYEIGARIDAVTTDVTATSEDFDLVFSLMAAGAAVAETVRFGSNRVITLQNGATALTLTPSAFALELGGSSGTPYYTAGGINGMNNGNAAVRLGGTSANSSFNDGLFMITTGLIGWTNSATNAFSGTPDIFLSRLAAGNLRLEGITAATNAVQNLLRLRHSTTGTAATGIGIGLQFEQDTGSDNYEIGAFINAVTTDVTATSEDFDVVIGTMSAGAAAAERLRISANGITPTVRKLEGVVTLTDGATPALDAALGNTFKLLAAGNRTIAVPTNKPTSTQSQKIIIIHEASGADRTLALTTGSAGAFRFGTEITSLTATTNGLADYIGCVYNAADDRWDVVAYSKGY